jgi:hypothetical protein
MPPEMWRSSEYSTFYRVLSTFQTHGSAYVGATGRLELYGTIILFNKTGGKKHEVKRPCTIDLKGSHRDED